MPQRKKKQEFSVEFHGQTNRVHVKFLSQRIEPLFAASTLCWGAKKNYMIKLHQNTFFIKTVLTVIL